MRGSPGTPHVVGSADEARQLGHQITDPPRGYPLVVTTVGKDGRSSFDAKELASSLRIHADVWVVEDRWTWALNRELGNESTYGDAAGVYVPKDQRRLSRELFTGELGTEAVVSAARAAVPGRTRSAEHVARAASSGRLTLAPGLHVAETADQVDLLAHHLLDPERDRPVAVITTPTNRADPWIDAGAIIEAVGPEAWPLLSNPDQLVWHVRTDRDNLRGSGRAIPTEIAVFLGPRSTIQLKHSRKDIALSWTETSNTGPAIGSLRELAAAVGAEDGQLLRLVFDRTDRTIRAHVVDEEPSGSLAEVLAELTGLDTGSLTSQASVAENIGAAGADAPTLLAARGDTSVAELVAQLPESAS